MKTREQKRSNAIREGFDLVSELLSRDVLLEIQNGLVNADTRSAVRSDVHAYLASKGVSIPEGILVTIVQSPPAQAMIAPPGLEHLITLPPITCPPGMIPTLVTGTVRVCADYGYIKISNPNPDRLEGEDPYILNVFGCLRFEDREEERWYCRWPNLTPAIPIN
ncbi:hypothetical protein V1290_002855 [Bradyrhizobium sp. AZCC 1578]|uniref:hypothetical protein n=1 Tax=Bradyrhizobium sp. AZCC 1578 TaxID=3117027 RepID=UPI002FF2E3B9